MSDTDRTGRPPSEARNDADRLRDAASRETASAREEAERAGRTVRDEASRLASGAKDAAYEKVEEGKTLAASSLNDFTAAIRKASDELGERDQSMAVNLVREAASGLESVSNSIEGQSVQDMARSVAGFARRQPTAFLIGAALAGVALGRFARASGEHDDRDYGAPNSPSYGGSTGSSYGGSRGYAEGDRDRTAGGMSASPSASPSDYTGAASLASSDARRASASSNTPVTSSGTSGSSSIVPGSSLKPTSPSSSPSGSTSSLTGSSSNVTGTASVQGTTTTPGATSTPGTSSTSTTPSPRSPLTNTDSTRGDNER